MNVSQCCQLLSLCNLDDGSNRDQKIAACRVLSQQLVSSRTGDDYEKALGVGISSLLRVHADADLAMWAVAEESLWHILRSLVTEPVGEHVLADLFKGVRGAERDKSRRVALARFADVCHLLAPSKCRRFIAALQPVLLSLFVECSEAMLETLAASALKLFSVFAFYMKESEVRELLEGVGAALLKGPSAACRRSCGDVAAALCSLYPRPEWEFCLVMVRQTHLQPGSEWPVVHGALVLLAALAREAAELMQRPPYKDPRAPLSAFGTQLVEICTAILGDAAASPLLWQGAAELAARLAAAIPFAVERLRSETATLRASLKRVALSSASGVGGRASALKALAAWGGVKLPAVAPDDDPLVVGTALINDAMRVIRKGTAASAAQLGALESGMRNESSVVARLAYESAGELMARAVAATAQAVARSVVEAPLCEYWVVERQRLVAMGRMDWSTMTGRLKRAALKRFVDALESADPRLRSAAAAALADAALYLGHSSVVPLAPASASGFTCVHEGAWKSVPAVVRTLLRLLRHATHVGAHAALASIATRWSSPRHYLAKAAARHAASQQRPLHPAWPNPLAGCFEDYAMRSVAQLLARPMLMCNLDHHQNVLDACAALAKGGGAAASTAWPFVLLHCLRVVHLYDPDADPNQRGDDAEHLDGGGMPYAALRARLQALQSGSLPSDGGIEPIGHAHRAYYALLQSALRVVANLAKDISRPVATFGHLILAACKIALPLTPAACLSVCRSMAPLCFRPATVSAPSPAAAGVMSPAAAAASPAVTGNASGTAHVGLSISSALLYASGLGRPAPVAEDFPAALNFSASRVEVALRMRPQLPALLEPLVLAAMASYPTITDVKVRARTLDLAVTLIRCGVDYRRLDPNTALVASIQAQILGKRAYLRDPMRTLPSMYTFLGVLLSGDTEGAAAAGAPAEGTVSATLVMQVAAPVFSSPYWRANAKLLPSLRWLLRDLVVRRRVQLQRGDAAGPDVFQHLRAHFVSCLVSKLPHEEAVEQLEALIRAARPVKSLMEELIVPAAGVVKALAEAGQIHVWYPTQWVAWRALVARMQVLPNALANALPPAVTPTVALDAEDPDRVLASVAGPLGELGGLLLGARMGLPTDKERLTRALVAAQNVPLCSELFEVLKGELDAGAQRKKSLFGVSDDGAGTPMRARQATPSPRPETDVAAHVDVARIPAPAFPPFDELVALVTVAMRSDCGKGAASGAVRDPFVETPRVPHARCGNAAAVARWTREQIVTALPLLAVDAAVAAEGGEVPDALFPLPQALFCHARRLPVLRAMLSEGDLAHMRSVAEGLARSDPDRNLTTERALLCLRGAIARPLAVQAASAPLVGGDGQCPLAAMDPHVCIVDQCAPPLWQTPSVAETPGESAAVVSRPLQWRAALVGIGIKTPWAQGYIQQLPADDDDTDPLLGFAVAAGLHPLPPLYVSTLLAQCVALQQAQQPSLVRAYALVCSLLRLPSPMAAALPWIRQFQHPTSAQWFTPLVLRSAMDKVLESLAPASRVSVSPMDAHEQADLVLRNSLKHTSLRSRALYCDESPHLLLRQMTPEQALSFLVSHLVRTVRAQLDATPVTHLLLRVLPALPSPYAVHVYLPSLVVDLASKPALRDAVVAFLVLAALGNQGGADYRRCAHYLAHALYATPYAAQLLRFAADACATQLAGMDGDARALLDEVKRIAP